jgi:hypothetical protein
LRNEANTLRAAADEATRVYIGILDRIAESGNRLPGLMSLFEDRLGRLSAEACILSVVLHQKGVAIDRLELLDLLRKRYGLILDRHGLAYGLMVLVDLKLITSEEDRIAILDVDHREHGEALKNLIKQVPAYIGDRLPSGDICLRPHAAAALLDTIPGTLSGAMRLVLGLWSLEQELPERHAEGIVSYAFCPPERPFPPVVNGDLTIGNVTTAATPTGEALDLPASSAASAETKHATIADHIVAGLRAHPEGLLRAKIPEAASKAAGVTLKPESVRGLIERVRLSGRIEKRGNRWFAVH